MNPKHTVDALQIHSEIVLKDGDEGEILGKVMGNVPSDPSMLREKWVKVCIYLHSWAAVKGFSWFIKGRNTFRR